MATYAISDIHGNWKRYKAFKSKLCLSDTVYVLGDVIDKGKDGIDILVDMINDGRFIILMGNHEHLMYSYLKAIRNENWDVASYYEDIWLYTNGGNNTYDQYCDLSDHLKEQIDTLFENMPIIMPDVIVNGRHFCLVHSTPGKYRGKETLTIKETGDNLGNVVPFIWDRVFIENGRKLLDDERIVIGGHTATLHHGESGKVYFDADRIEDATYIDIDGGCAYGSKDTSLIALRLDDLTPFSFTD